MKDKVEARDSKRIKRTLALKNKKIQSPATVFKIRGSPGKALNSLDLSFPICKTGNNPTAQL